MLLAGALMLSAGGATAQQQQEAACPDPPGNPAAGERVSCREGADSEKDISVDLDGFDIDTMDHKAIYAHHEGAERSEKPTSRSM